MLELASLYSDHVEAKGCVWKPHGVRPSRGDDSMLLDAVDRPRCSAKGRAGTASHLDEDDRLAVAGYYVDLAAARAEVPVKDIPAARSQRADGALLGETPDLGALGHAGIRAG